MSKQPIDQKRIEELMIENRALSEALEVARSENATLRAENARMRTMLDTRRLEREALRSEIDDCIERMQALIFPKEKTNGNDQD